MWGWVFLQLTASSIASATLISCSKKFIYLVYARFLLHKGVLTFRKLFRFSTIMTTWFGLKSIQLLRVLFLLLLQILLSVLKYSFRLCRFLTADILAIFKFRFLRSTRDFDKLRTILRENHKKNRYNTMTEDEKRILKAYLDAIHAKWRGNKDFWLLQGIFLPWSLRRKFYLPPLPKWFNRKEPRDFYDQTPFISTLFAYFSVAWRTDLTITFLEILPAHTINARVPGMYESLLWYAGLVYYAWRIFVTPYLWFGLTLFLRPLVYWDVIFLPWHLLFICFKGFFISLYGAIWYLFWSLYWLGWLFISKSAEVGGFLAPWNDFGLSYKSATSYSTPRCFRWNYKSRLGRLWIKIWFQWQLIKNLVSLYLEPVTLPEKEHQARMFFKLAAFAFRFFTTVNTIIFRALTRFGFSAIIFIINLGLLLWEFYSYVRLLFRQLALSASVFFRLSLKFSFCAFTRLIVLLFLCGCESIFMVVSFWVFFVRLLVELLWTPCRGLLALIWAGFFVLLKAPLMLTLSFLRSCQKLAYWCLTRVNNRRVAKAILFRFKSSSSSFLQRVVKSTLRVGANTRVTLYTRASSLWWKTFQVLQATVYGKGWTLPRWLSYRGYLWRLNISPAQMLATAGRFIFPSKPLFQRLTHAVGLALSVRLVNFIGVLLVRVLRLCCLYLQSKFRLPFVLVTCIGAGFSWGTNFLRNLVCQIGLKLEVALVQNLVGTFVVGLLCVGPFFKWLRLICYLITLLVCRGLVGVLQTGLAWLSWGLCGLFIISDKLLHSGIRWLTRISSRLVFVLYWGLGILMTGPTNYYRTATKLVNYLSYRGFFVTYLNPIHLLSLISSAFIHLVVRFFIWFLFCPILLFSGVLRFLYKWLCFIYSSLVVRAITLLCILHHFCKACAWESIWIFGYFVPSLLIKIGLSGNRLLTLRSFRVRVQNTAKLKTLPLDSLFRVLPIFKVGKWIQQRVVSLLVFCSVLAKTLVVEVILGLTFGSLFFPNGIFLSISGLHWTLAVTTLYRKLQGLIKKIGQGLLLSTFPVVLLILKLFRVIRVPLAFVMGWLVGAVLVLIRLIYWFVVGLCFILKVFLVVNTWLVVVGSLFFYLSAIIPSVISAISLLLGYWVVIFLTYRLARMLGLICRGFLCYCGYVSTGLYSTVTVTYEELFKVVASVVTKILMLVFFFPWFLYRLWVMTCVYTTLLYGRWLAATLIIIPVMGLTFVSTVLVGVIKWTFIFVTLLGHTVLMVSMAAISLLLRILSTLSGAAARFAQSLKGKAVSAAQSLVLFRIGMVTHCTRLIHWLDLGFPYIQAFWITVQYWFNISLRKGLTTFRAFSMLESLKWIYSHLSLGLINLFFYGLSRCVEVVRFTCIKGADYCLTRLGSRAGGVISVSYLISAGAEASGERPMRFLFLYKVARLKVFLRSVVFYPLSLFCRSFLILLDLPIFLLSVLWRVGIVCFVTPATYIVLHILKGFCLTVALGGKTGVWLIRRSLLWLGHCFYVSQSAFYTLCAFIESWSFTLYTNRVQLLNLGMTLVFFICRVSVSRILRPLWRRLTDSFVLKRLHTFAYLPKVYSVRSVWVLTGYLILLLGFWLVTFIGWFASSVVTSFVHTLIYLFTYVPNILLVTVQQIIAVLVELPVVVAFYFYILVIAPFHYTCSALLAVMHTTKRGITYSYSVFSGLVSPFITQAGRLCSWIWLKDSGNIRTGVLSSWSTRLYTGINMLIVQSFQRSRTNLTYLHSVLVSSMLRVFYYPSVVIRGFKVLVNGVEAGLWNTEHLVLDVGNTLVRSLSTFFSTCFTIFGHFRLSFRRVIMQSRVLLSLRVLGVYTNVIITELVHVTLKLYLALSTCVWGLVHKAPTVNTLLGSLRDRVFEGLTIFIYGWDRRAYRSKPKALINRICQVAVIRLYQYIVYLFISMKWVERQTIKAVFRESLYTASVETDKCFLCNGAFYVLLHEFHRISSGLLRAKRWSTLLTTVGIRTQLLTWFKNLCGGVTAVGAQVIGTSCAVLYSAAISGLKLIPGLALRLLPDASLTSGGHTFFGPYSVDGSGFLSLVVRVLTWINTLQFRRRVGTLIKHGFHACTYIESTLLLQRLYVNKMLQKVQVTNQKVVRFSESTADDFTCEGSNWNFSLMGSFISSTLSFLENWTFRKGKLSVLVLLRGIWLGFWRFCAHYIILFDIFYEGLVFKPLHTVRSKLGLFVCAFRSQLCRFWSTLSFLLCKLVDLIRSTVISIIKKGKVSKGFKLFYSYYNTIITHPVYVFLKKTYIKRNKRSEELLQDMEFIRKRFFKDESREDFGLDVVFYLSLTLRSFFGIILLEGFTIVYAYLICHRFVYGRWRPNATYMLEDIHGSWVTFESYLEAYIQRKFKADFKYPETHLWENANERAHARTALVEALLRVCYRVVYWFTRVIFNCVTLYPAYLLRLWAEGLLFLAVRDLALAPLHYMAGPFSKPLVFIQNIVVTCYLPFERGELKPGDFQLNWVVCYLYRFAWRNGWMRTAFVCLTLAGYLIDYCLVLYVNKVQREVLLSAVVDTSARFHWSSCICNWWVKHTPKAYNPLGVMLTRLYVIGIGCWYSCLQVLHTTILIVLRYSCNFVTRLLIRLLKWEPAHVVVGASVGRVPLWTQFACWLIRFGQASNQAFVEIAKLRVFLTLTCRDSLVSTLDWLIRWSLEGLAYVRLVYKGIHAYIMPGVHSRIRAVWVYWPTLRNCSVLLWASVKEIVGGFCTRGISTFWWAVSLAVRQSFKTVVGLLLGAFYLVLVSVSGVFTCFYKYRSMTLCPATLKRILLWLVEIPRSPLQLPTLAFNLADLVWFYKGILSVSRLRHYVESASHFNLIALLQMLQNEVSWFLESVLRRFFLFVNYTTTGFYATLIRPKKSTSWITPMTLLTPVTLQMIHFLNTSIISVLGCTLRTCHSLHRGVASLFSMLQPRSASAVFAWFTPIALQSLAISARAGDLCVIGILSGIDALKLRALQGLTCLNRLTNVWVHLVQRYFNYQFIDFQELPGDFSQVTLPFWTVELEEVLLASLRVVWRWTTTFHLYITWPCIKLTRRVLWVLSFLPPYSKSVLAASSVYMYNDILTYKYQGPSLETIVYKVSYFLMCLVIVYPNFLKTYYQAYKKALAFHRYSRAPEFLIVLRQTALSSRKHLLFRGFAAQSFPDYMQFGANALNTSEGPFFFFTRFWSYLYRQMYDWTLSSSKFLFEYVFLSFWQEIGTQESMQQERFDFGYLLNLLWRWTHLTVNERLVRPLIYVTYRLIIQPIAWAWPKASDSLTILYLFVGSGLVYLIPVTVYALDVFVGGVWTFKRFVKRIFFWYCITGFLVFYFSKEPLLHPYISIPISMVVEPSIDFFQTYSYALNAHLRVDKILIHGMRWFLLWFFGFTLVAKYFELGLYQKVPRLAKVALALIFINHVFINPETFQLSPDRDWDSIIVTWAYTFYYVYVYAGFFHYLISIKMVHWAIWYLICLWVSIAANWPKRSLRRLTDVDEAYRRIKMRVQHIPRGFYAFLFMMLYGYQLKQLSGDALIPHFPPRVKIPKLAFMFQYYEYYDPLKNLTFIESTKPKLGPPAAAEQHYLRHWYVDWSRDWLKTKALGHHDANLFGEGLQSAVFPDALQLEKWPGIKRSLSCTRKSLPRYMRGHSMESLWGDSSSLAVMHPAWLRSLVFWEQHIGMGGKIDNMQRSSALAFFPWPDLRSSFNYKDFYCFEAKFPLAFYPDEWFDWATWQIPYPDPWEPYWWDETWSFTVENMHDKRAGHHTFFQKYKQYVSVSDTGSRNLYFNFGLWLPSEILYSQIPLGSPSAFWETPVTTAGGAPGYSLEHTRAQWLSDTELILKKKPLLEYYNLWNLPEPLVWKWHYTPAYSDFELAWELRGLDRWILWQNKGPWYHAWVQLRPYLRTYTKILVFLILFIPIGIIKLIIGIVYVVALLYDIKYNWNSYRPEALWYAAEWYYWLDIYAFRPKDRHPGYVAPFFDREVREVIKPKVMPIWEGLHIRHKMIKDRFFPD